MDPLFATELELGRGEGRRADGASAKGRAGRDERKTRQLCRQAWQALTLALAGECDDDVLRDLTVEAVEPAPNASRLLVGVSLPPAQTGEPAPSVGEVMDRLGRAAPKLRHCIARAITRKRAPELTFIVTRAGAADADWGAS